MESNFDQYIRRSACYMNECPYGHDISCRECVNRMIAEHDANVRAEARAEILSEIMGEMAMLNETKMTEGDLKGFAYRIRDIVERGYAQNAR